jgi:hypothetical protein
MAMLKRDTPLDPSSFGVAASARRARFIVALVVLAGFVAWRTISYLRSPLRVVRQARTAVLTHDSAALLSLASAKERDSLGLTTQTVRRYLAQVPFLRGGSDVGIDIGPQRPYYADVVIYGAYFTGPNVSGSQRYQEFYVYQDATGKWRLGLSMLLFSLNRAREDLNGNDSRTWDAAARRSGIIGCTIPAGPTRYAADGSHSNGIQLTLATE